MKKLRDIAFGLLAIAGMITVIGLISAADTLPMVMLYILGFVAWALFLGGLIYDAVKYKREEPANLYIYINGEWRPISADVKHSQFFDQDAEEFPNNVLFLDKKDQK